MKRIAIWLVLVALALAAFSSAALAWEEPNVVYLEDVFGDGWYNYDFDYYGDPDFPDWPTGIIWRSSNQYHGTVDYVKGKIANLGPGYVNVGSGDADAKWNHVYDGVEDWDDDRGRWTNCYSQYGWEKRRHIRVYAPDGTRFYNYYFGYYSISNVHAPHYYPGSDCENNDAHMWGWSEDYEGTMLSEAAAKGYSTYVYAWNTQNNIDGWEDDDHYQKSNGYAARVTIP